VKQWHVSVARDLLYSRQAVPGRGDFCDRL
jgi:hypothetical protein